MSSLGDWSYIGLIVVITIAIICVVAVTSTVSTAAGIIFSRICWKTSTIGKERHVDTINGAGQECSNWWCCIEIIYRGDGKDDNEMMKIVLDDSLIVRDKIMARTTTCENLPKYERARSGVGGMECVAQRDRKSTRLNSSHVD